MMTNLKSGKEFDMIIVGGGATGSGSIFFLSTFPPPSSLSPLFFFYFFLIFFYFVGIALDAATRGLSVALVEMDDFGSGTSSKSTKLLHGGVR